MSMQKRSVFFFLMLVLEMAVGQIFASPREGFYIGAGVGASFDDSKIRAKNTIDGVQVHEERKKSHAIGDFFLGYGHTFWDCYFLGFEGGTYFPRRRLATTRPGVEIIAANFENRVTIQDYFTGDILPGFRVCPPLLIYARGGFTVAHVRLKQDANAVAGVPEFKNSVTKCGGRVGVGINYSFARNWALGLDYFYSSYPKVQTAITGFSTVVDAKTHTNYVGVSIIYNFPICCN